MKSTVYSLLRRWRLLFLLLLVGPCAWGQAPIWQMAVGAGPGGSSAVSGTAVDAQGNVYITGEFTGSVSFGSIALAAPASGDLFVAKWSNATQRFAWATATGGGPLTQQGVAIAVSGSSVYVVGTFASATATFGSTTLTNAFASTGIGYTDIFVAKLLDTGTAGTFVWAERAGGIANDIPTALAVRGTSLYLTGYMYSPTTGFGNIQVGSAGGLDGFVAKMTDNGSSAAFTWVQAAASPGLDQTTALAVEGTNVYIAGWFSGATAMLGSTTLTNAAATGFSDMFVAKLVDAGPSASYSWALAAGGQFSDGATGLAVRGADLYVTGFLVSPLMTFGSSTVTNADPTGSYDGFVAKLTETGNTAQFVWAQQLGGRGYDQANALAAVGTRLYVAGSFQSTAAFGSQVLSSSGGSDVFVAGLDDLGPAVRVAWVQQGGGINSEFPATVVAAGASTLYVGGRFQYTTQFGLFPLAAALTGPTGAFFLAALYDPTLTATASALPPKAISLFPNPAHGTATMQLPVGTSAATITVLDALGRVVKAPIPATSLATSLATELDLTGLAPGLYAVRVAAGGSTATRRLVVE